MTTLLQPGQHPDADQLSAFAENALPLHEREQTLAHLATCSHCRDIVALSLPPFEETLPQPVITSKPWLSGWKLALAFAATAIVAVLLHHPTALPPTQIAEQTTPPPIQPQPAAPQSAPAKPKAAPPAPLAFDKQADSAAIDNKSIANLPLNGRTVDTLAAPKAAPPAIMGGPLSTQAGSFIAGKESQSNSLSTNGNTNQFQTQAPLRRPAPGPSSNQGQVQSQFQQATAAPPMAYTATAAPSAPTAAETISVDASAQTFPVSNKSITTTIPLINLRPLPSHLAIASTITRATQTLALDTAGTLFLTTDNGSHWKRISTPWLGRAVHVNLASYPDPTVLTQGAAISAGIGTATLTGIVTDPSGATIPNATVTTPTRTTTTDPIGRYTLSNLPPGTTQITATAPGFHSTQIATNLFPSQQATINITLPLGAVSQSVTVTSEATESATGTLQPARKRSLAKAAPTPSPTFAITTETGERWLSTDGLTWHR